MDDTTASRAALEAWKSFVGTPEIEPMPRVNNLLWRVLAEDGRVFVLRRLPEFPPGVGPVDQFRVLGYLQAAGIPVAPPIVTDQAGLHASVGDRLYELLPFVLNDSRNHELGPDAAATSYAIGAAIARLDKVLAECPWQVRSYVDDPVHDILEEKLPNLPSEVTRPVAPYVDQLRAAVTGLPVQRTHGDCNTGNVLIHGKGVSGFIDLDHLPIGPRVRDLSYYLASRLRAHLADPETAERDAAAMTAVLGDYVGGYHETYPLSERELAAVVPLILLVEIGLASWSLHGWTPSAEAYQQSERAIAWIIAHLGELATAAGAPQMANSLDSGTANSQ
ncbi:phosphotransferase enzyme family protein [Actinopolymorpha alba]|uniref:phosphotransferase enzyme family protein n=1 Tax=Actinopolymorpha alba TaxID=533267 RepID=UPI00035FA570|nr:phosphotransferase [Actinopolymorpha alba]